MASIGGANIVTNGLVLCLDGANKRSYPGSGTAWVDLSGNQYVGTLTNGPTFDSGNYGNILFDGTDDYVNFGTSGVSKVRSATTMTISYTVYCTGFGTPSGNFSWSPITSIDSYTLGNNYRKLTISFAIDTGVQSITTEFYDGVGGSSVLNYNYTVLNTLLHVTSTINATEQILYVNGSRLANTTGITINSNPQTADFTVASRINTLYNGYFKGNMYNVMMYDRVLSAAEVSQNYNALKSRFNL